MLSSPFLSSVQFLYFLDDAFDFHIEMGVGHAFTPAMMERAEAFFERWLKGAGGGESAML